MKNHLIIILLLIVLSAYSQKGNTERFLSNFEVLTLPANTNSYNKHFSRELEPELALKHIFRGQIESSKYYYEIYSDDDNTLTESGYSNYNILPINYFSIDSIIFITYYKGSFVNSSGCFLAILDAQGIQSDSLLVYQTQNEYELWEWTRAIFIKDEIIIFRYLNIPTRISDNNVKTVIKESHYIIDRKKMKFSLLKEEEIYSEFEISTFFLGKEESRKIDPFFKL